MVGQVDLSQVLCDEAMANNNIQDQKKTSALLHLVLSCLAMLWMNICIYNYKLLLDLCSVVWMLCLEITGHAIFNQKLIVHLNSHNLISILTWLDLTWQAKTFWETLCNSASLPIMRCIWWSMQRPYPGLFSIAVCSVVRLQSIRLQPKSRRWWWGRQSKPRQPPSLQACKATLPTKNPPPGRKHYQKYPSTIWKTEINLDPIKLEISVWDTMCVVCPTGPNANAWGNFTQKSGVQEWMGVVGAAAARVPEARL